MKYRSDIDGLRAFAVLVVVWFHAGLGGAGGGFTGVDVFFVISGYLIGGIIIEETANGRFSYLQFYARRAKRLFSAFFVVSLVTIAAGWWLLLPGDLRLTGKTLVAAAAMLSNVLFYQQVGYFDSEAITKPLLHTWSLAVEEQFYLFFPLLMVAALRMGNRAVPAALALSGLASLLGAQILLESNPSASFYLLPTRAWELLLGTMVALPQVRNLRVPDALRGPLTLAAVAGLCLPVLLYHEQTSFPGLAAVPSCAGTAWLLWNGNQQPGAWLHRALGMRIPVFIGKISYSLYLWHWPVIVYITYFQAGQMNWNGKIIAILMAFGLAVLTWRYVEQPARLSKRPPLVILGAAGIGAVVLVAIGLFIWRQDGVPGRLADRTRSVAEAAGDFMQWHQGCESGDNQTYPGIAYCAVGAAGGEPGVLVWGDSHARTIRDGIDQLATEQGLDALIFWAGGCLPGTGFSKHESASTPQADLACARQNEAVMKILASAKPRYRTVLLVGRWAYYAEGAGTGRDAHNTIGMQLSGERATTAKSVVSQAEIVTQVLRETVAWLRDHGYEVYILEQPPEIPHFTSRQLFQALRSGQESYAMAIDRIGKVSRAEVEARQRRANQSLEAAAANGAATILRTHDILCDENTCSVEQDIGPAYFDNNHLRSAMSQHMRQTFLPALQK